MNKLSDIKTKLYAFSFFDDFILIYPLYSLLFADKGVSARGIASLFVAWSLIAFLSEIPAGVVADRFPRRQVLFVAVLVRAIGYSFWLFMPNYTGFLIGFILWGLKGAFTSGTLEALVYDELHRVDELADYAKVTGRMKSIGAVGDVLACFGAALLTSRGYITILLCSVLGVLISGLTVLSLPRSRAIKEVEDSSYLQTLKNGVRLVWQKPLVLYLVVFMSVVAGMGAVDEYLNLFLREKGYANTSIVLWAGVIFLFGAIGSLVAHRFESKKLPLNIALFAWALLLVCASIAPKFMAPVLIGLYISFFFAVEVLFNAYLQHHISDKTRATTTSVGGFLAEFFAVISYLIVGFGAKISYAFSFKLVAVSIAILAIFLSYYSRKNKLSI